MGSNEIKIIAFASNSLFKSTKHFTSIRESLESSRANESFTNEQVSLMRNEYTKRLAELERFERELDKIEKRLSPSFFDYLKKALIDQKLALSQVVVSSNKFLDSNDQDYMKLLLDGFDKEKSSNAIFGKEMQNFSSALGLQ